MICFTAFTQGTIDQVLEEVEKNNTGLKAFHDNMEARSKYNKTGIYLQNPEFDYAWFAGNPASIGSKTNISIRQQFDFPTSYSLKKNIAHTRNEQLQIEFEKYRMDLFLETRLLCLELIYTNAMVNESEKRLNHAQRLTDAFSRMLEEGEVNRIEYNKAKLNLLDLQKKTERITMKQNALQINLAALNGGIAISLEDTSFASQPIVDDFEHWFNQVKENTPLLRWLQKEITISKQEQRLQRAMNLPSFNAGYVSESLTNEQFRGFAVGISIPLWENKSTMQFARAHTSALQSEELDKKLQFYHQIRAQHTHAVNLKQSIEEYEILLTSVDNTDLLTRAWEAGEISLTAYLLELSFIYQSRDNILEMQLELEQTLAKLYHYNDF